MADPQHIMLCALQRVIEKAVFDELCDMLDSGVADPKKLELKKGKSTIVMFVGLQGSGKTTTCTKWVSQSSACSSCVCLPASQIALSLHVPLNLWWCRHLHPT